MDEPPTPKRVARLPPSHRDKTRRGRPPGEVPPLEMETRSRQDTAKPAYPRASHLLGQLPAWLRLPRRQASSHGMGRTPHQQPRRPQQSPFTEFWLSPALQSWGELPGKVGQQALSPDALKHALTNALSKKTLL